MQTRKEPPLSREEVSIYIGDLDHKISKHDLFTIFNSKGTVQDIMLPIKNGKPLGYAYINYETPNDAQRALAEFGCNIEINGTQCRVMKYSKKSMGHNIFVKNLESSINNKSLQTLFGKFGTILSAKVVRDAKTNESLGYGYINFEDEQSATNAVQQTNGMMVKGQQITTEIFIPKQEREERKLFTNVYCKFIPPSWTEQKLLQLFGGYGTITSHSITHRPIGTSACINYQKPEQAKLAIANLNGLNVDKHTLYVARAQKKKDRKWEFHRRAQRRMPPPKAWMLFVSNIPYHITNNEFAGMFRKYGMITKAFIVRDYNGISKGRGFVSFTNKETAARAQYEMDEAVYYGRTIYVQRAREQRNNMNGNNRNRNDQQWRTYAPQKSISPNKFIVSSSPSPTPPPRSENRMMNRNVYMKQEVIENQSEEKRTDGYMAEVLEVKKDQDDKYKENQVSIWLREQVKLAEYIGLFKDQGVEDVETLTLLTEDDLEEMGITKFGHKKKLMLHISRLKEKEGTD